LINIKSLMGETILEIFMLQLWILYDKEIYFKFAKLEVRSRNR
jgi:hypothetical protein